MFKALNPKITFAKGLTMSVQASRTHYSIPREDDGPYTHVEIGFPMGPDGEAVKLDHRFDEYDDLAGVYAYVPVDLIQALTEEWGDIIEGSIPDPEFGTFKVPPKCDLRFTLLELD